MLDIIGIGSLNLDFTATAAKINALPISRVREAMKRFEYGGERFSNQTDISNIRSLLGPDSFRATLGGSAFNTICAMSALNSGIKAGYVGVAGHTEDSGLNFVELMRELFVDHRYVGVYSDQSSGLCISINHDGIRSFLYYPGCNKKMGDYLLENRRDILLYLAKTKMLHVTQFAEERISRILDEIIQTAKKENPALKISCDPGYCWLENLTPAVMSIIRMADFLFLNTMEFNLLCGGRPAASDIEKAKGFFEQHAMEETLLIVKNARDITIYCRLNQKTVERIYPIDVLGDDKIVDATGAGDIFAAGFLTVQLLPGATISEAVELGVSLMRAKLSMPHDKLYGELTKVYSMHSARLITF